jgi:hypothetical protein
MWRAPSNGMVFTVLIINLGISGLCWYGVWQLVKIRRSLVIAVQGLDIAEQNTHAVLHGAPLAIARGQIGVYQLRQQYRRLELQLQKVQMLLSLLSWGQMAWLRLSPGRRQRRSRWAKKSMMVGR